MTSVLQLRQNDHENGGHRLTGQLFNRVRETGPPLNDNMFGCYRVVPPNTPPRVAKDARETHETHKIHKRTNRSAESYENIPRNKDKTCK